jgi:hypothetical protein
VGNGWLATGNNFVDFVQWINSGGDLGGSAQAITAKDSPPSMTTNTQTLPISGRFRGSTLVISFDGGAANFGTLAGNSFTLNFPQTDGSLAPVTFHSASVVDFNQAVADLKERIAAANRRTFDAQALQQAEQKLDQEAAAVSSEIGGLARQSPLTGAEQSVGASVQKEDDALGTVKSAEQKVKAEAQQYPDGNNGNVCYDASNVGYDASNVGYDASNVGYAANDVQDHINKGRNAIKGLQSDFAQYQSDQSNLPQYQPANPPTQAAVSQAVAAANAAIASAVATTNGHIDHANEDVTTALNYTAQASAAGNCSSVPTAPTPQSHIS